MAVRKPAGYSGKSVAEKLGIREGCRLLTLGAPDDYASLVGPLPAVAMGARAGSGIDLVHVFSTRRADLSKRLSSLRKALRSDAVVWVSWPKKAAGVPTDITEDTIREVALPLGYVDVKVCAVSEVWSGLKLVVRTSLR